MKDDFKSRVKKNFKEPLIKPSHKGLFTKKATAHGEGVQEYANQVLAEGSKASPATKKQANFAKVSKTWKH